MNNDEVKLKELCNKWVNEFLGEGFGYFQVIDLDDDLFSGGMFVPLSHLDIVINKISDKVAAPSYLISMAKDLLENGYENEAMRVSEIAAKFRGDFFSFKDLKEGDDVWCLARGAGNFVGHVTRGVVSIRFHGKTNEAYYKYNYNGQLCMDGAITLFRSKTEYINALIALTESQL